MSKTSNYSKPKERAEAFTKKVFALAAENDITFEEFDMFLHNAKWGSKILLNKFCKLKMPNFPDDLEI